MAAALAYLLCGVTGSGKTVHAKRLEAEGCVRLSVDELVEARHGRYDIDYPASEYLRVYDEARGRRSRARPAASLNRRLDPAAQLDRPRWYARHGRSSGKVSQASLLRRSWHQ